MKNETKTAKLIDFPNELLIKSLFCQSSKIYGFVLPLIFTCVCVCVCVCEREREREKERERDRETERERERE